jgi:hypothetical protein
VPLANTYPKTERNIPEHNGPDCAFGQYLPKDSVTSQNTTDLTVPLANTYTKTEPNFPEHNESDCAVDHYLHKDRA